MKKILIISLKHLGDIITTTTILPLLKEIYPISQIDYMVNHEGVDLIKNHPLVEKVYLAKRKQSFKEHFSLFKEIKKEHYDIIIDYSEGDRSAFWGRLSSSKIRIGYDANKKFLSRNILYTHILPDRTKTFNRHVTDCHADAIKKLGYEVKKAPVPSIFYSEKAKENTLEIFKKHKLNIENPYAVLHLTARDAIRLWPPEHCANAIDYLYKHVGQVILVSWKDPRERAFIESIKEYTETPFINLCGEVNLDTLMYLLEKSKIFIGLDSLVGHAAAALKTPTIGIFGPSSEVHWGPKGEHVKIAHIDKACRPCVVGGCLGDNISECLKLLTFEQYVKPLIDELLE